MKILLVGAGYVGRYLLQHGERSLDQFIVTTTTQEKVASLEKLPRVEKVCLNHFDLNVEGIVVCVAPKKGADYKQTYLHTAQALKQEIAKQKRPLHLIYTSSTSVYGKQDGEWVDEKTPLNPQTEEGNILVKTEEVYTSCLAKVTILRLGGIFGPGRELQKRAARFSEIEMPGSGLQPTNHSYLTDITHAIAFCFQKGLEGIYNVVGDNHPTREELYSTLCTKQGLPPPLWKEGATGKGCVSNQKMKEAGFIFEAIDLF